MNTNKWIAVAVGIFVVGFFLFGDVIVNMFKSPAQVREVSVNPMQNNSVDKLQIQDVVLGTGGEAVSGSKLTVQYTGALTNGQVFDSSVGKQPFHFTLGAGEVISGWDNGLVGMKVGGKRRLVIPPNMGYGSSQVSVIPPNSTLIFEVELLNVE